MTIQNGPLAAHYSRMNSGQRFYGGFSTGEPLLNAPIKSRLVGCRLVQYY